MSFQRQRQDLLTDLAKQEQVSVLIVGAGINGSAVFRELACQKVDALLVDQSDFCTGASAASSNLIHGGLRYLEYGEFRLVREAIQERNRLLRNAEHFVKPLPTRIPLFSRSSGLMNAPLQWLGIPRKPKPRGAWAVRLGLTLYDAYSRTVASDLPKSKFVARQESLAQFPALNPSVRMTAQYYDAIVHNPERLALQLVQEGESRHSQCRALNYLPLKSIGPEGVVLEDQVGGEQIHIKPRVIVNAAGPWIDLVNGRLGLSSKYIGGTKGSHLVLEHDELFQALQGSMFFFENSDGRAVLICPWHHRVIVGTTDIPIQNPDEAVCSPEEEAYLLDMVSQIFPEISLAASDVVFRYSGVRPLGTAAGPTAAISRDHRLQIDPSAKERPPMYSLIGGKWTTFRAFAEQTVDALLRELRLPRQMNTQETLIGTSSDSNAIHIGHCLELESDLQVGLLQRYGEIPIELAESFTRRSNPHARLSGTEYFMAELEYLCRHERVIHLDDLLLRRTQLAKLGLLTPQIVQEVAALTACCLNWSEQDKDRELESCLRLLKEMHGVSLAFD